MTASASVTSKPTTAGEMRCCRSLSPIAQNRDELADIEEAAHTTSVANTFGAVAENWIRDPEGNRVDIAEHVPGPACNSYPAVV